MTTAKAVASKQDELALRREIEAVGRESSVHQHMLSTRTKEMLALRAQHETIVDALSGRRLNVFDQCVPLAMVDDDELHAPVGIGRTMRQWSQHPDVALGREPDNVVCVVSREMF